ncbi:muscular LMNA-interacting protein-like isoform X2 [Xenopus laevis]|uniref:Muscular LMNA-interacting protein-like isoform X2 n=1 Tax=Xenopus laevis TaxID=8355 RepID=A0A8J1KTL8_XENLA|nr:muscular LMNA-interacting protein-like isoform X2 [Xenopus laevis]
MDLERHKTEIPSNKTLRKKIMISLNAPGTQSMNFTFIPTLGTLPSEVLVGKDHNYKPKVVSCRREEISAKPEGASVTEKNKNATGGRISDSYHTSSIEQNFPGQRVSAGQAQDMQQNDLFIAEFVLVMDSDEGEDEVMNKSKKAFTLEEANYKISGAQLRVVEKPTASLSEVTVNEICIPEAKPNDLSRDVNCKEKELELHSTVPSTGSVANKPQLANSYSTNPRLNHKKPLIHCISESREFLFSSAPYNICDEQTLEEHTSTPNKPFSSHVSKLCTTPVNTQHTLIHGIDETFMKASQFSNELEMQDTVVIDYSTASCEMRNIPSPFQINVIRYPLCASPSPLQSPYHGSSSTICSMGESGNPISPASSCEAISPVSSHLSFLTSVLRSKKTSYERPHSLNSSQFNITSQPTAITRKAVSCFSLSSQQESKRKDIHRQAKAMPSVSESNILQTKGSFHQRSIRTLSPDSEYYTSVLNSPRTDMSSFPPYCFKENSSPTKVKPNLNKPFKRYPLPAKYRKVASLPLNLSHSSPHLTSQKRATSPHAQSSTRSFGDNRPTNYTPAKFSNLNYPDAHYLLHSMPLPSNTELQTISQLNTRRIQISPNENKQIVPSISLSLHPNEKCQPNTFGLEELSREHEPITTSLDRNLSSPKSSLSRSSELLSLSQCSDHENKKLYRIKPNYKVFAAIPTNKLLLDQKALDEPEMNEETSMFVEATETQPEVYSPALLRQQTEEVCAVIDEVLHESLPLHCDSSRPGKKGWDSKCFNQSSQKPKSSSGSAGRETKYASLQSQTNAVTDCQQTRPGVIRPLAAKVTYTEKKDDDCSSNPFSHFTSSRKELNDQRGDG